MESEYEGRPGPAGIPIKRPKARLTPSDRARLQRIVGVEDPAAPLNSRAWTGESLEPTQRQENAGN